MGGIEDVEGGLPCEDAPTAMQLHHEPLGFCDADLQHRGDADEELVRDVFIGGV